MTSCYDICNDLPFLMCTILHLGLHVVLSGLDKIGWTANVYKCQVRRYMKGLTAGVVFLLPKNNRNNDQLIRG